MLQSLTLVTAVRIFFNQDGREAAGVYGTGQLYNILLALCLLIILIRIPRWVQQAMFMPSGGRSSTISRMFKTAIAYKLASPILRAAHLRGGGKRAATGTARAAGIKALAVRALPAAGGPAATAAAAAAMAARRGMAGAANAARGGPGPIKHAPVGARRPAYNPQTWQPAPVKHAPTAPAIAGKYQPTPRPKPPVKPTVPVYGYPRENFYAAGPAGLGQMQHLRMRGTVSPPPPRHRGAPAVHPIREAHRAAERAHPRLPRLAGEPRQAQAQTASSHAQASRR
ncbi:hypothetical protein HII36_38535 [Nonomuraea sp. NN258]|uniref:hypothetical protein n=1 Tax=Nonomuraea antri TaxID=2730852 RepID=UPI001569352C|nr:hypothetical protein [Nonomuraea antri]NRQ37686.1 hypothetical protein [Nonomuraea antri]